MKTLFCILFLVAMFPTVSKAASTELTVQKIISEGFITAVLTARDGAIWAADEERCLFRNTTGQTQTVSGLADAYCYAIAEDSFGRLWVGSGKHGVSVYDGNSWQNIGPAQGLAGCHVYSILCASDGSVWVGTEGGLSNLGTDGTIKTFRVEHGLPSNEIADIAEDRSGNIWCAGFTGGAARLDKRASKAVLIPPSDLATAQLNDLCLDSTGMLWLSGSGGITVYDTRTKSPLMWLLPETKTTGKQRATIRSVKVLPDEYIRCVCEKSKDTMYIGTRRKGLWLFDAQRNKINPVDAVKTDFVFCMARGPNGGALAGGYGGGLWRIAGTAVDASRITAHSSGTELWKVLADRVEVPPGILDLALAAIRRTPLPSNGRNNVAQGAQAIYVGEDYTTQGDWIGRYGRFYYILCAMMPPFDFSGGPGGPFVWYDAHIGERHKKFPVNAREVWPQPGPTDRIDKGLMIDDSIRYWIHWPYTDNSKVLLIPEGHGGGGRRQSDWDDHGEAYPFEWAGPHLYFDLLLSEPVPEHSGIYLLSLYFMNKDGHEGNNRFRDYSITIKPMATDLYKERKPGWEKVFDALPVLASARLHDFRAGVYKKFLIREGRYTIKIDKCGSFNTILSGVFIDKVSGDRGEPVTFTNAQSAGIQAAGGTAGQNKL